jgi:dTDP-4-dehydrorhamnose 3,5-epimerase
MNFIKCEIPDVFIIQPNVFEDDRGYFFESFTSKAFENLNINVNFVQDNQSLSQQGVLRGLHFQEPPHAQGKLVRVIKGAVLDVAVDIRKNSQTYGKYIAIELNEQNKTMLWIPVGFAHGFLTLKKDTIFFYKCTNYYNKPAENCILWNDPDLNINWKINNPVLSPKDKEGIDFKSLISNF